MFHVLRDSYAHGVPILGGLWGAVNGLISPRLVEDLSSRNAPLLFNDDQRFLAHSLWPIVKSFTLAHDSYFCEKFNGSAVRPFPTRRKNRRDFVGNVYSDENSYSGLEMDNQSSHCPVACRPFPEWNTC